MGLCKSFVRIHALLGQGNFLVDSKIEPLGSDPSTLRLGSHNASHSTESNMGIETTVFNLAFHSYFAKQM